MNPESIRRKFISNRINGFHAHPGNHGNAKTQTADRADRINRVDHVDRAFLWRISTAAARETLTNSFMTYRPIDLDTDMAKVPYSVTTNQSSTPIQKPSL